MFYQNISKDNHPFVNILQLMSNDNERGNREKKQGTLDLNLKESTEINFRVFISPALSVLVGAKVGNHFSAKNHLGIF